MNRLYLNAAYSLFTNNMKREGSEKQRYKIKGNMVFSSKQYTKHTYLINYILLFNLDHKFSIINIKK